MITPDEIKAARLAAGLTQAEAAALVYRTKNMWQKWEYGDYPIDRGLFELFKLKTQKKEK